ncbi:4Fe-4S dicluster domain-containing protein [Thermodesulfobacteriota bacterium]
MGKISLLFLKEDCMGCHACEVACKQEHDLGVGPRLVRVIEKAPLFIPFYCHHCAKAPCKSACPSDAIYRNERGIVLIDKDRCIGCRECLEACPFGAMQFDDDHEIAVKCDLCINRLDNHEKPACVQACGTRCIVYGDGKELSEKVIEAKF